MVTVLHCTNSPASDEEVFASRLELRSSSLWSGCCSRFGLCDARELLQAGILSHFGTRASPPWSRTSDFLRAPECKNTLSAFTSIRAIRRRESAWPYSGKNSFPFVAVPFALVSSSSSTRMLGRSPSPGRRGLGGMVLENGRDFNRVYEPVAASEDVQHLVGRHYPFAGAPFFG